MLWGVLCCIIACSDSDEQQGSAGGSSGGVVPSINNDLSAFLDLAIADEYKARNTYQRVIDAFGNVRPFVNIKRSEEQHIQLLAGLYRTYGFSVPSNDGSGLPAPASLSAACQVGVEAEIANGALYAELLAGTKEYQDVQDVFVRLRDASLNQHLPAFQRCAN